MDKKGFESTKCEIFSPSILNITVLNTESNFNPKDLRIFEVGLVNASQPNLVNIT